MWIRVRKIRKRYNNQARIKMTEINPQLQMKIWCVWMTKSVLHKTWFTYLQATTSSPIFLHTSLSNSSSKNRILSTTSNKSFTINWKHNLRKGSKLSKTKVIYWRNKRIYSTAMVRPTTSHQPSRAALTSWKSRATTLASTQRREMAIMRDGWATQIKLSIFQKTVVTERSRTRIQAPNKRT